MFVSYLCENHGCVPLDVYFNVANVLSVEGNTQAADGTSSEQWDAPALGGWGVEMGSDNPTCAGDTHLRGGGHSSVRHNPPEWSSLHNLLFTHSQDVLLFRLYLFLKEILWPPGAQIRDLHLLPQDT